MKQFGPIQSFDPATGSGFIHPYNKGRNIGFNDKRTLSNFFSVNPGTPSYHLRGKNGVASAPGIKSILSLPQSSRHDPFSVCRSAMDAGARDAKQDASEKLEGDHMSSTTGRVVHSYGAKLPYKVILEHADAADTEHHFASMRESEAFIRRNTPKP